MNALLPRPARPSRRRRTVLACLAAAGLGAGLVPAAQAAPAPDPVPQVTVSYTEDPADSPGKLDLERVGHRIAVDYGPRGRIRGARVGYQIRTYGRMSDELLDRARRFAVIELDTDDEAGSELNVRVYAEDGRLRADLISNATREVLRQVQVRRIGPRTVRVVGDREVIGARKYFVVTNFHRRGHDVCGLGEAYPTYCQDVAPRDGWLRLDRPAWPGTGR